MSEKKVEQFTGENKNEFEQNSKEKKKGIMIKTIAIVGMLSAIATVLQYLEIPIFIMPSFVKFDFSDLPALVGAFVLGPIWGCVIELIKNLIHMAVSQSGFIGELANFILGSVMCIVAGFIYKARKTKKIGIVAGIVGAIAMGIASVFVNYFITYPFYIETYFNGNVDTCIGMYTAISDGIFHVAPMTDLMQCLLVFNLPFTIVKGLICTVIGIFIYKPLSKAIKSFILK